MRNTNLHGVLSRRLHLSALLVVLLCSAPISPQPRESGNSPWHRWKSIRLKAKSVPFLSGRVWMHLTPGKERTTLETETTARFFGARVGTTRTRTEMDTATGLPRNYVSYNSKRARRFTFEKEGYRFERLRPDPKKRTAPLSEWPIRSSDHFAYPVDSDGQRLPVYDHYGMILHLRNTDLTNVGDELVVHVATSHGPTAYRIRVSEVRAAPLQYRTLPGNQKQKTVVREMRLQVVPEDSELAEGFMNMKGETELWVEANSKTLLRIGGHAPKIGKVTLVLAGMG